MITANFRILLPLTVCVWTFPFRCTFPTVSSTIACMQCSTTQTVFYIVVQSANTIKPFLSAFAVIKNKRWQVCKKRPKLKLPARRIFTPDKWRGRRELRTQHTHFLHEFYRFVCLAELQLSLKAPDDDCREVSALWFRFEKFMMQFSSPSRLARRIGSCVRDGFLSSLVINETYADTSVVSVIPIYVMCYFFRCFCATMIWKVKNAWKA